MVAGGSGDDVSWIALIFDRRYRDDVDIMFFCITFVLRVLPRDQLIVNLSRIVHNQDEAHKIFHSNDLLNQ